MKAVAYSVLSVEKEYFAKANKKKHDITLIANPLGMDTLHYAEGKEAIIMPAGQTPSDEIIHQLCILGIKYIFSRGTSSNEDELQKIAEQTVNALDQANDDDRLIPAS